jgi:hypothetical protein
MMIHLCEWPEECGDPAEGPCHDWIACGLHNLIIGGALYAASGDTRWQAAQAERARRKRAEETIGELREERDTALALLREAVAHVPLEPITHEHGVIGQYGHDSAAWPLRDRINRALVMHGDA